MTTEQENNEISLSKETIDILKSFSVIHMSISIKKGNELLIKSTDETCMASCKIQETFPRDFNCYDINEFIQAVNLIDEPVIDFSNDNYIIIKSANGGTKVKYTDSEEDVIKSYPKRKLKMPDIDITLLMTQENLKKVMNASNVLKTDYIGFKSDGKKVSLISFDKNNGDNSETNSFSVEIGDCEHGKPYQCYMESNYYRRLKEGTYDVNISEMGIVKFSNRDIELDVYHMLETDSTF